MDGSLLNSSLNTMQIFKEIMSEQDLASFMGPLDDMTFKLFDRG